MYLRARYYAPGIGRFLSKDTWNGFDTAPQSFNRWAYVGGNPVNRTDPSGNCWYPDLQTGGTNIDITNPSTGVCPWFVNLLQQNGISIPANATPENWVNNLPPTQQELLAEFMVCVNENQFSTYNPVDYEPYVLIRFYTSPEWEFFTSTSHGIPTVSLKLLGWGGEGGITCDTVSFECTMSTQVGGAISMANVMGFELGIGMGLGFEKNLYTGQVHMGATIGLGPCDLFVSISKLSVGCSDMLNSWEVGWQRRAPQEYWVLARNTAFGSLSWEQYASSFLNFQGGEKIHYRVEGFGTRESLIIPYMYKIDYILE